MWGASGRGELTAVRFWRAVLVMPGSLLEQCLPRPFTSLLHAHERSCDCITCPTGNGSGWKTTLSLGCFSCGSISLMVDRARAGLQLKTHHLKQGQVWEVLVTCNLAGSMSVGQSTSSSEFVRIEPVGAGCNLDGFGWQCFGTCLFIKVHKRGI